MTRVFSHGLYNVDLRFNIHKILSLLIELLESLHKSSVYKFFLVVPFLTI